MRHWCTAAVALAVAVVGQAGQAQSPASSAGAAPVSAPAPSSAPTSSAASAARVQQWIRELDDDRFAVREAASAALVAAGRDAVAPLAKAAVEGGLEVTTRCVRVLAQLATSEDPVLAESARDVLEKLDSPQPNVATDRAAAALESLNAREAERARDKAFKLGAGFGSGRNFRGEGTVNYHLVLRKNWAGGNDGIKLLRYLDQITYLSIHGAALTDEAVPHLARLKHLEKLELYGTRISEAGVQKLKTALPNGDIIDVRRGGLLGVQGQFGTVDCQFTEVRPNSAASKAGLQPGDIVRKCDGKPIENFKQLLDEISARNGGDKLKMEIERGEEKMDVEVTLGNWGDD
jgi:hypothetical protein